MIESSGANGGRCCSAFGTRLTPPKTQAGELAVEFGVGSPHRKQLGVGALFDDPAAIQHENPVCMADRCLLYTSPSPRDRTRSRMPSSA